MLNVMRGLLAIRIQEDEHYIIKVSFPSMVFFFFVLGDNEEVIYLRVGTICYRLVGFLGRFICCVVAYAFSGFEYEDGICLIWLTR